MILRIILQIALLVGVSYCERLNRYVSQYEVLNYDTLELHSKHDRARRSVPGTEVELDFDAHGRQFKLRLQQGAPHLSKNLIVETGSGETQQYEPDFLYIGHLEDNPDESKVYGGINKGVFQGVIHDGEEEYHVERAQYHLEDSPAHSVIYKASDVTHPDNGGCGLNDRTSKWMDKIRSAKTKERKKRDIELEWAKMTHASMDNKYAAPRRAKRAVAYNPDNTACNLFLQADHTYTAHYGGDVSEVITQLNNHVSAVNDIYTTTEFSTEIRGISFVVTRIRVNGTEEQQDPTNPFRFDYLGVEKFLEYNSQQNHDPYCLAYVFADRDFNDGVLGLAWVGAPGSTSGGICEEFQRLSGTEQSLNTGVVTIQNYGSTVASKVSHITFAHELGHNFGSPHDYPLQCRPGDNSDTRAQGNFIMYASATSGDKVNNGKFSPCSISNMTAVIDQKGGCFQKSDVPVCGNLLVDEGEECDCGYEDQCNDPCCDATTCMLSFNTLGVKVACSPSQGPCCTETCMFASMDELCRRETECSNTSFCAGSSSACPVSPPAENGKECNDGKQVCTDGECQTSICTHFGMVDCFCEDMESTADLDEACHICCQDIATETCMSLKDFDEQNVKDHVDQYGEPYTFTNKTTINILYQIPGAPCDNYLGYCDVFYKCRAVDSNGPLSRLKDAILNPQLYSDIATWIQSNWWAAVLIALGVIIFMGLFIKCCSVHTPSSNPNLPKHRKVSVHVPSTLRRQPRQGGRGAGGGGIEMA